MKKWMTYFLLAAMLMSLCGCSRSREAGAAGSADIHSVKEAYDTLSEEEKRRLFEELSAEQEENKAEKMAELVLSICGQWRMENPLYYGTDSVFAEKLLLSEDMTYEYGRQKGTWSIEEETGEIWFRNDADGVCYFIWTVLEEDGLVKLLCEGDYTYVREEEYRDNLERKFVIVLRAMAQEYFGEPQYVGVLDRDMGYGTNVGLCILDSLAYEKGLVYVGHTSPFEMEVVQELKDGTTVTQTLWSPFEYLIHHDGAKTVSIRIESGMAYFVRSEYVKEVVIDADGIRKVVMKTGDVYYDYNPVWNDFPEISHEEFQY